MQISLESLEGLQRKMTIVVPVEEVKSAYRARLEKVAKNARIDGFRPGKVPPQVLDKKFGASVLNEVAGELVQKTLQKAIEEKEVRMVGMPNVDFKNLKKDEQLEYAATFDVYPEIALNELDGQEIEKVTSEITEADIDKMIETVRKQHAEWTDVDREAKQGDRVTMDFEGFIEEEAFEGGKANGFQLEIGSKQMIPGFEDGVLGVKPGSDCEIKLPFPDDYHAPDLAGKDAQFKITVHKVEEAKLPPVDDKLAEKMGIKEGGLDAFKKKVRDNMERELKQRLQAKLKEQTLNKLTEQNKDVLIPKALIDQEIEHLKNMTKQQMAQQQGGDKKLPEIDLPSHLYEPQAKQRVLLGLLLSELVKKHELKVEESQVKDRINELSSSYEKPEEVAEWYFKNKQVMSEIEASVLEDMAVEKLLESAKVNEKAESYDKIVGSGENS